MIIRRKSALEQGEILSRVNVRDMKTNKISRESLYFGSSLFRFALRTSHCFLASWCMTRSSLNSSMSPWGFTIPKQAVLGVFPERLPYIASPSSFLRQEWTTGTPEFLALSRSLRTVSSLPCLILFSTMLSQIEANVRESVWKWPYYFFQIFSIILISSAGRDSLSLLIFFFCFLINPVSSSH